VSKLLIGMVHVPPLPGSPRAALSMDEIEERAVAEALILRDSGFDGCIVENFGDVPFHKDRVPPATVAAMARLVAGVRRAAPEWRIGVNVLRNDARAALAIAATCGARFVRVNVHVGATATDQGVLEGRAAQTLRLRSELGAAIEIWADVHVKHGRPVSHADISREAEDAVRRGLADALIVSGAGTGEGADLEDVGSVARSGLRVPILVGSGVDEESVGRYLAVADGVIVGSSLKAEGVTTAPLDPERARRFIAAARAAR
jgi:uncharacterized protein